MEEVIEINKEEINSRFVEFNENYKFDPIAFFRLTKFIKEEDIDILHLHLPYSQTVGRLAAKLSQITNIVSTQHNVPQSHHPVTRYSEHITRRFDDSTVAVSNGIKEANLNSNTNWLTGKNTEWHTIHNPIDVIEFNKQVNEADPLEIESDPSHNPILLNVSRYVEQKSHSDLITAMKDVVDSFPDAHLYLVGRGPLEDELRDEISQKKLENHITVTGYVTQKELYRYYSSADLFVLSSVREGFGIVLIEAMAAELPIVATDIPGVNEVVKENETGILVEKNAPEQLSEAICTIKNGDLGHVYGMNGYDRTIENFSVEKSIPKYKKIYDEMSYSK